MTADLLTLLWHATLACSIAVVLVLSIRKPLRHRFGAQVAYSLWALVPVAIGVSLIPAPVSTEMAAPMTGTPALLASQPLPMAPVAAPAIDVDFWLLCAWLGGFALWVLWLAHQQRRFLAELGRLDRYDDDAWRAQNVTSCPALIGAWRPRIVLPQDFDERYTDIERTLILAHERTHVARADAALNLGVSALRCVFWFNPLIHAAASRFRFDQELACDAAVISRFPEARRPYADAMLKTQLIGNPGYEQGLPVGCHWQSSHPLKERISMLKSSLPSPRRKRLGIALSAVFVVSLAAAAWAGQPKRIESQAPGVGEIQTQVRVKIDGHNLDGWTFNADGHDRSIHGDSSESSTITFTLPAGQPFNLAMNKGSESWRLAATPEEEVDGTMRCSADVSHNGTPVGRPLLLTKENVPAGIRMGEEAADGSFKGFEAQITMASNKPAAPPSTRVAPTQHATYRSITRIPYPAAQAKQGIGGAVFVVAHIGVDGRVVSTGLKAGPGTGADVYPLVTAALQGVQGWTFNPAEKNGKPVPSDEIVPIVFKGGQPLNVLKIDGELEPIEVESANAVLAAADYSAPTENVDFRKMHPPAYPTAAIKAKRSGHVVVKVLVSAAGEPESAEMYEAEPPEASLAFADSSIAAVMQWRFNPGMRDGEPVPGYVLIPFDYNITDDDEK
jgi:bla regulator protein blaR1